MAARGASGVTLYTLPLADRLSSMSADVALYDVLPRTSLLAPLVAGSRRLGFTGRPTTSATYCMAVRTAVFDCNVASLI